MSSTTFLRLAARIPSSCLFRSRLSPPRAYAGLPATTICSSHSSHFSTSVRRAADKDGQEASGGSGHHEESFEEFTARYGAVGPRADLDALGTEHREELAEASG